MTPVMKLALDCILRHVAHHGATPSVEGLAAMLGRAHGSAQRLIGCLIERGKIARLAGRGLVIGGGGVAFALPGHTASALCRFALEHGEDPCALLADAVTLHLDQIESVSEVASASRTEIEKD